MPNSFQPVVLIIVAALLVAACQPSDNSGDGESGAASEDVLPEATSLLGDALYPGEFDDSQQQRLTDNYVEAQQQLEREPDDPESWIWAGRRAGYLWQYRDAIETFTQGIDRFPDDARLLRHRGHRYISIREFDLAIRDLEEASQLIAGTDDTVEPDGAPNAAGIPISTLHTNIWYHLGLAYYLVGDFGAAIDAFKECLAASTNNDMMVATVDWL